MNKYCSFVLPSYLFASAMGYATGVLCSQQMLHSLPESTPTKQIQENN